jgi:asparagine synthase (glutamine-hydrolysing)
VDEMIYEVREKIIESVRLRLRADVPVGIYLSGGLDSSSIAGIAKYLVEEKGINVGNQDLKQKLACFSIQFDKDSGFDESGTYDNDHASFLLSLLIEMHVDIAERTAKFLGVDMHLKKMNEAELAKHFEDCVWHSEHFISDLNSVGKFALSELPRDLGFKVILSGEGADEMFGGYAWFLPDFLGEPDQSSPDLPLQQDDLLRQRLHEKSISDIKATFRKKRVVLKQCEVDHEVKEQLNGMASPMIFTMGVTQEDLYLPAWQNKYTASDLLRRTIDTWSPSAQENIKHNWHVLHSAMYAWAKCQLPNYLLTTLGDRGEMAHSIEGRPPFLDHHLAELMGDIPPSLKMYYCSDAETLDAGNGAPWDKNENKAGDKIFEKWILREAVKPFLSEELYLRRKHPFTAPVKWPKGGPLHQLFTRLLTRENIGALGFIQWSTVQKSLEAAFGDESDSGAWRSCLVVGSMVVLSQRFGVPPVSTK